jgi:hypothetical protein
VPFKKTEPHVKLVAVVSYTPVSLLFVLKESKKSDHD